MELMEAEKIILTLGESLGYVYGTVMLRCAAHISLKKGVQKCLITVPLL